MTSNPYDIMAKAATEFPPTLEQKQLLGKTFCINGVRLVTTKFGQRHIAVVRLQDSDEDIECWLGGVRVDRQLSALQQEEAFPVWVKLGQDQTIEGEPYILEAPDQPMAPPAETWAKKLSDLGKLYEMNTGRALELLAWKPDKGESAAACYKRGIDELIKSAGSREEANRLVYEQVVAAVTGGIPDNDDSLPFE
jgi:hypothetical protein